ncbi:MAG: AI-2E family transporter [Solirubrobacteraceae bacterium]|nr:AI-2E family transporter [Solirubrobacteraceae bacterium]
MTDEPPAQPFDSAAEPAADAAASVPQPRPAPVALIIPVRTMLALALFAGLVALALLSLGTLVSILLATVLALGLDPPVAGLVRRGWSRGAASLTAFFGVFAAVIVLVLATAGPLWSQIVDFVESLPAFWEEFSSKPGVQEVLSTAGADTAIRNALTDLAAGLPDAANTLLGMAAGVFGSVLSLVTLAFLALFLLMERPTISTWLFGFTTPEVEDRWEPVLEESITTVSSSLIGNIAISVLAGTLTGLVAWALDMPFPIVLAVMTGLLDLIPQVGATIAAVILVMIALTVSTQAAIIMLIVQLIYQQVENYVIYPIVYRRAVSLSGFTTITAVLISGALLGVVGAILAVPFAAILKVVTHELGRPRRERMAALRGVVAGDALPGDPAAAKPA